LIIMSPNGLKSAWREAVLLTALMNWAAKDGTGIAIGPSGGYKLRDGAILEADASWVRSDRLAAFTNKQLERFAHLCPDFAAEIKSPSNRMSELKMKMAEYIENGAQLAWLIDPYRQRVYIYRPGKPVERLESPAAISGDPVLPGFIFNVSEIL